MTEKNGQERKRAALHNLGCKVNAYELDVMEQLLVEEGYEIVPFTEQADVYIVNTCTVTNIADRKSRQLLHRARRQNPEALVVAVGCYVQTAEPETLRAEGIDLCIGNNQKGRIASLLAEALEGRAAGVAGAEREAGTQSAEAAGAEREAGTQSAKAKRTSRAAGERTETGEERAGRMPGAAGAVVDVRGACEYEDMQLRQLRSHTRAYIKIQDGCNQYCTYCIIPTARGRVRSRRAEEIVQEVRALAESGAREFVLTGIHISSYGADLAGGDGGTRADRFCPEALLRLLRSLDAEPGVARLRLGSLEPRIITEGFVRGLKAIGKLCPHFHLSLQSGSDEILRRMNRHYTAAEYAACVARLRAVYDDPAITTDIIAGFPGETEEQLEESCRLAEEVGFYEMHIFPYSRRRGTPAAELPEQHTEAEKARRVDRLEEVGARLSAAYRERWIGTVAEVLLEGERVIDGERMQIGHTPEYLKVAVAAEGLASNTIRAVRLSGVLPGGMLRGELAETGKCRGKA